MLSYRVDIADLHAHEFLVTLTIPEPAPEQRVSLPVWIPGSYLVREFARHLSHLQARQGSRELVPEQLDKASWLLRCEGRGALVLSYRVYAFDTSVRAAFLDARRGFFNGTSLFLRVHGREAEPHALAFGALPKAWRVATAMPAARGRLRYEAADYEEFVDHPFELGDFWRGEFTARGVTHQFVVAGALPSFDGERLLADAQRICEAQSDFWHGKPAAAAKPPFEHYVFLLNTVGEGGGGLEHRASTALIAPRADLPRVGQSEKVELSDAYVRLLGLISHEYFHTWNVKRMRPDAFARFDFERENYTELLWFFEGFTSYYDDLFLLRCGLIDAPRYLKLQAANVSQLLGTPGREVQSVAQASFDAWVKFYRADENTPNATVSYYIKGGLIGLALDLSLRGAGLGCEKSETPVPKASTLDALMRALWIRSAGGPLSEADITAEVTRLGGAALAQTLLDWVHGTAELPLPVLLERVGVSWQRDKPTLAQRLGLRLSESALTGVQVKQVLAGSAAMAAGLCAGDEILACNGWRLRRLEDALLSLSPEQPEQLLWLVARDQRLLELSMQLPAPGSAGAPVSLSLAEQKASACSLGLRRSWLGG
jgi:predicted metalloprotease with PDZ domain